MRRIVSALLVLALCLSLVPFALAERESSMTQQEVEASAAQAGLEGRFVTLDALGLKFWLLDGLTACGLPESVIMQNSYVAYYMNGDQTSAVGVTLQQYENSYITREELLSALAASGITQVEFMSLNGLPCLTYTYDVQDGLACTVITVLLGEGAVAEFAFALDDTTAANAKSLMTQSIMSAE